MSQNGTNKITVDCPACKQRFSISLPPIQQINGPTVSIGVATHERPVKCFGCAARYVLGTTNIIFHWAMQPITEEQAAQVEGTSIIVPAGPKLKLM